MKTDNIALLLIDIQIGLFNYPGGPLYKPNEFLEVIKKVLKFARSNLIPIIYVQHESSGKSSLLNSSQPGWSIHPQINPKSGDYIVHKNFSDSFKDTDLNDLLVNLKIKNLIVAGLQTDLCVDTTVRQAFSRNYNVTVIKEGHSTYDNEFITAEQIINHHNLIFHNRFAKVKSITEFI